MRRAVLGAVALLVVVAVLLMLTGCGGDPKADPSPSPSSPVTSPVSTTPSAPVMPAEAKAEGKAGAMAFVKYYVELINHAQATGDTSALAAAEMPKCHSCQTARNGVQAHYEAGGSIKGGDWRIEKSVAVPNPAVGGWNVDLSVSYGRQVVSYGTSQPDKVNPAGEMVLSVQVGRVDDAWRVFEWVRGS
jgi:hypothetical protein